jgi:diguanylate cyclase (GGDEF)-like protein
MFAVAEWAFASGMEAATVSLQNKIFWAKTEYLGAVTAPTLFFIFSLEFCRKIRSVKPVVLVLLSIIPFAGFAAAVTNQWHGLIWNKYIPVPGNANLYIYGHGPGYFVLVLYDYLLISAGVFLLSNTWLHAKQPYRRQVGMFLLGSIFPFLGGIVYSLFPGFLPGLDLTPVSFMMTGLVIAFSIFKFRLLELAPISRDVLIETMEEGVLLLDLHGNVADINPVALDIIGVPAKAVLGQPIREILASWTGLADLICNESKTEAEFQLSVVPTRCIHVRVSPLFDQKNHLISRLLVFRDVTLRRRMEKDLANNIEELGIINQISLAVTSGLDMEHVLRTLHQQCSQVVPIDIFYVALYDESSSLIQIPLFYENGEYQTGLSRDINDHPGTIGKVIQSRKTIYQDNFSKKETTPLKQTISMEKKPGRSYIGIPLTLRERVIGVMSIQNYHEHAYSDYHIRILERISIQAAIAIENARLYSEVQRLAIIDELTGIYNYRGLQELGTREVERAHRFNRPLSLLFFDLDDFRNLNNTYSHTTGNIILQSIANRCRTILRNVDVLARFGGDEFVVLLPESDITNAEDVARRLAEIIGNEKIATPFGEVSVSVSIGVTSLSEQRADLPALIEHANQAEKQAKIGKKGIVVIVK